MFDIGMRNDFYMSYKIAYLAFEWNYEHQTAHLRGMEQYVKEHRNVQIFTFNAVAKYLDEDVDTTTLEILNLPDLSKYDGIVLQGNRLWRYDERQKIVDEAWKKGIPVVSINYPLEHAIEIGADNYMPIVEIIKGLKERKQIQTAVFVCGYENSREAQMRKKAYLDACEKYEIKNLECLKAGWNTEDGKKAATEYLKSQKELPDCFICANDNGARSFTEVLMEHGISVPDDVIVTGFDNQELSYAFLPRLTSVDRNDEKTGYLAIDTLIKKFEGTEITEKKIYAPYTIRWRLDQDAGQKEDDKFWKRYVDMSKQVRDFSFVHSHYEPAMLACGHMDDLCNVLESFGKAFQVKEVFFSLNQGYIENYDNPEDVTKYSPYLHLMAMHSASLMLADPKTHVYQTYPTTNVLPEQVQQDSGLYIVYPLHYRSTILGCVITNGIPSGSECGFVPVFLSLIETALENVRRRNILNSINQRLDEMYVHDSLTGCYNRFGLEKYGKPFYDSCLKNDNKVYLLFADIDNMKSVNDQYGHEYGDAAIRTSALLLKEGMQNYGVIVRYGGDEFLMILSSAYPPNSLHIEKYPLNIGKEVFYLSLSIGEESFTSEDSLTFEKAIEKVDHHMYEIKKMKKISRG